MKAKLIRTGKLVGTLIVATAITIAVLWGLWTYAGPVNAIVYTVAFLFMLGLFPIIVALGGNHTPGNKLIAKLHRILGALAFGRTVLVDRGDRFEQWPATRTRVYIDGQWYPIEGGLSNWSMLGWRPFGITRFKDEETLVEVRADTVAERLRGDTEFEFPAAADGGTVERGGLRQVSPPGISGTDGRWLIDLKRLFTQGLQQMGAIDIVETVEEVAQREQAASGLVGQYSGPLTFLVSLVLGIIVGYAYLAA